MKNKLTANICDPSEKVADKCHGTAHGPDAREFKFRRAMKRDYVRAPCDLPVTISEAKSEKM